MTENEKKLKEYLDSVYVMSHSYCTIAAYRIAIVNQNKTGFRDYLQQQYNIDELEFVDQTKQEKFDVYAMLRDHVVFLDQKNYKPKSKEKSQEEMLQFQEIFQVNSSRHY